MDSLPVIVHAALTRAATYLHASPLASLFARTPDVLVPTPTIPLPDLVVPTVTTTVIQAAPVADYSIVLVVTVILVVLASAFSTGMFILVGPSPPRAYDSHSDRVPSPSFRASLS